MFMTSFLCIFPLFKLGPLFTDPEVDLCSDVSAVWKLGTPLMLVVRGKVPIFDAFWLTLYQHKHLLVNDFLWELLEVSKHKTGSTCYINTTMALLGSKKIVMFNFYKLEAVYV